MNNSMNNINDASIDRYYNIANIDAIGVIYVISRSIGATIWLILILLILLIFMLV